MMISLQTILLLSIGITHAVASAPNCSLCEYFNGIGYIRSDEFCGVYYMCIRYPYDVQRYKWYAMCCPEFMTFDVEHQTCKSDPSCLDARNICPQVENVTYVPCPNFPNEFDKTKYFVPTGEEMTCPPGTLWDQFDCTCVRAPGEYTAPCAKLLHYGFNDTYDSYSCNNHASGVTYGRPALDEDMLCLNGKDQFLTIPFLNNYFAWNPVGKTFTMSFWLRPFANQTAGLLSTNCYSDEEGSVAEFSLDNGELVAKFGRTVYRLGVYPTIKLWSKVCITFEHGLYIVYYNGYKLQCIGKSPHPTNSHSDTTLGFVRGKDLFYGYFDDFCFWTRALNPGEVYLCYAYGPSNYGYFVPPPGAVTSQPLTL